MPRSLKVLKAHLGDGDRINPDAWRAALRVFEHAYGKPREEPEELLPLDDLDLTTLTNDELHALRRRLLAE